MNIFNINHFLSSYDSFTRVLFQDFGIKGSCLFLAVSPGGSNASQQYCSKLITSIYVLLML